MLFYSCSADNEAKAETPTMNKIYITIDGQTQSATLVDNDATRELVAALQNAPITVTLNDNDFEIWGSLGKSLTTKNEQMTALPGDIVGHIDGLSENELRTFLKAGESNISVTLSLAQSTGIRSLSPAPSIVSEGSIYSLNGQKVTHPSKGIYIKNGKKVIL